MNGCSPLNLPANGLKEAATHLVDSWGEVPFPLHRLPFNRFEMNRSQTWWLTRQHKNPAYAVAKFIVSEGYPLTEEQRLFCGLHVERGLNNALVGRRHEQLAADWIWHSFLSALADEVSRQIQQAWKAVGGPIQLHVLASSPDGSDRHRLRFDVTDAFVCVQQAEGPLAGAAAAENLSALQQQLLKLPAAADYYWIDIHIGREIQLQATGPDDTAMCLAMLRCFQPWLARTP